MAKKDELDNIFKRTDPGPGTAANDDSSYLDHGPVRATGVGLREGEIAAIDLIGAQLGELLGTKEISRNALLRVAARRLIFAIRSGELPLSELAKHFEKPDKPRARIKL